MKYIAFCDTEEFTSENRMIELSSSNVVRYMAEALGENINIEIIAPIRTRNKTGFYHGRTTEINNNATLTVPSTFGTKTRIGSISQALWMRVWLLVYMFFHTKRNEQIIVYHSYDIINTVKFLKFIKHYKIIMECREIYSDIRLLSQKKRNIEINFLQDMDKYIFPSEVLNRLININNKPYVIAPSIYKAETALNKKINDGRIHAVYAGTFEPRKGGAMASVYAAEFLPENYHVHILGRGDTDFVNKFNSEIKRISSLTKATVTYDGVKFGDDFKSYIQQFHIGLSTQNANEKFNDTSFPSKILTYIANGLDVVSAKIRPVVESPVSEYLYYYDEQTPQSIADAIMSIDVTKTVNKTDLLNKLDFELKNDLKNLINHQE